MFAWDSMSRCNEKSHTQEADMRLFLKAGMFVTSLAVVSLSFAAYPAQAAPTGPTGYAIKSCWNGQWQVNGYSSYYECAHVAWNEYCKSEPLYDGARQECSRDNPFPE